MTFLNLTRDPVLVLLLKNMIRGASQVSTHDQALKQRVQELKQAYQAPTQVAYEPLVNTVSRVGEILSGYELNNHKNQSGQVMTLGNEISALPGIIFNFKTRLDDLKTKSDLDNRHFVNNNVGDELSKKAERFLKLVSGK